MKNKIQKIHEQNIELQNAINSHSKIKSKANVKLTMLDGSRLIFSKYNGFEPLKGIGFRGSKIKDLNNPFKTIEQENRTLDKFKKNMMFYDLNGYRA
ncbi:MAG: hypothetical protein IJX00_01955 [Clostridia bacterium]|nr:hypothetical protein [Clostridia bacterium]